SGIATVNFANQAVSSSVPKLLTVLPETGLAGTSVNVTLTGRDFIIGGTTINIGVIPDNLVTVVPGSVIIVDATTITATFRVDAAAAHGPHDVTVTTAFGTSFPPKTFTVPDETTTKLTPCGPE